MCSFLNSKFCLGNTRQQQWKFPLPEFIEEIYFKHFKKRAPENIRSIEQMVKDKARKKAEIKMRKEAARSGGEAAIT